MPNGIEFTPGMIESGVEALAGSPEADGNNPFELIAAIYLAMERARRATCRT